MNPRSIRQKVALGFINGVSGEHKFYGEDIPEGWWRADVCNVLTPGVALMYPNDRAEQYRIEDTKGSIAMWAEKYIKPIC